MRSLPAFLMAFIVTVIISGALMIGCGGSGDPQTPFTVIILAAVIIREE